jgi:hypothetical protein
MAGEHLDLESSPGETADKPAGQRRFIGIHFACCDRYARIYVNREETAYIGNCPRCLRQVTLKIGPGGSSERFFTAY